MSVSFLKHWYNFSVSFTIILRLNLSPVLATTADSVWPVQPMHDLYLLLKDSGMISTAFNLCLNLNLIGLSEEGAILYF